MSILKIKVSLSELYLNLVNENWNHLKILTVNINKKKLPKMSKTK